MSRVQEWEPLLQLPSLYQFATGYPLSPLGESWPAWTNGLSRALLSRAAQVGFNPSSILADLGI